MRGGKQTRVYYETPGQRLRYFRERDVSGNMDAWRLLMEIQAERRA
ncbi:MAG: hypothetical protein ACI4O7_08875 [Aristaeellaceae bacterium]